MEDYKIAPTAQEVQTEIDNLWILEQTITKEQEVANTFAVYAVPRKQYAKSKPYVIETVVLSWSGDIEAYAVVCASGIEAYAVVGDGGRSISVAGWEVVLVSSGADLARFLGHGHLYDERNGAIIVNIGGGHILNPEEIIEYKKNQEKEEQKRIAIEQRIREEEKLRQESQRSRQAEQLRREQEETERRLREQCRVEQETQNQRQQKIEEIITVIIKEIQQKQQNVNNSATQYERTINAVNFDDAVIEIDTIERHIVEGASSLIISERAIHLRLRCEKSRADVPCPQTNSTISSEGGGLVGGAFFGGILGLVGGPLGLIAGAVIDGFLGAVADSDTPSHKISPELEQWTKLIQDVDEVIKKLPKEQ